METAMSKVTSFKDLSAELRALVIELTLTRVRSDHTYPMDAAVKEALLAAQVLYGVDRAQEEEEEKSEDPSQDSEESLEAASFLQTLQALFDSRKPTKHCGNPRCTGCNDAFGELKASEPEGKPKYTHIHSFVTDSGSPINVFRFKSDPLVYAVTQGDRTVILQGGSKFDIPVELIQQILDKHGSTDISLG